MASQVFAEVRYVCTNCHREHVLNRNNFVLSVGQGFVRENGTEVTHSASPHLKCENCSQPIQLNLNVSEYPAGVINKSRYEAYGATILNADFEVRPHTSKHLTTSNSPVGQNTSGNDNSRALGAAAGGAIFGASIGGPFGALIGGILGGLIGDSVDKGNK